MHERAFRRALAIGAGVLLLVTTTALADTVQPSSDGVTLDTAGNIDLGTVAPGATVTLDLSFKVVCGGSSHVAPDTSVSLVFLGATAQGGGSAPVSASPATVGPAPGTWSACTAGQSFGVGSPSHVAFTAPATPGPASYVLLYLVSPSGAAGSYAGATLDLTVSGDQPPALHLPGPMTFEGNTTGGATVSYTATATDAEDAKAPAVTCSPASGSFFALGTTTVSCSATDSAGQTTTGTFDVTVVDTTPPSLSGVPAPVSLTTYDAGGGVVTYPLPMASDVVDAAPAVACVPASGSVFPVGTTSVSCTATDHSGNTSSAATFPVTVTQVHLAAIFEAPIGPSNTLAINPGRTLPVKTTVTADGVPVTSGDVTLALSTCGGGSLGAATPLAYQDGRWVLGLDTSGLTGCTTGTLLLDGHPAGTFTVDASSPSTASTPRRHR